MTGATLAGEDHDEVDETVERLRAYLQPVARGQTMAYRDDSTVRLTIDGRKLAYARTALDRLAAADGADALSLSATRLAVSLQDLSGCVGRGNRTVELTVDPADCGLVALAVLRVARAVDDADSMRAWGLELVDRLDDAVAELEADGVSGR